MKLFACKLASPRLALDSLLGYGRWRPIAEGKVDSLDCFISFNRGDVETNITVERILVRYAEKVFI